MNNRDKLMPETNWLTIKFIGWNWSYKSLWFYYWRLSNAGMMYIPFFQISWRLSWHKNASYQVGWDACFRQLNKYGEYSK